MSKSGLFIFGSMGVTTAGLGIWQLKRYYWKTDLLDKMGVAMEQPPSTLSEICDQHGPDIYGSLPYFKGKKVKLTGTFDHSKELFLGLRSAPHLLDGQHAQGMATNPLGYYVITPFHLSDGKGTVFVNRGWVPKNMLDFPRPELEGDTVVGEVQETEAPNAFSPINQLQSRKLLWLSSGDLLEHLQGEGKSEQEKKEVPMAIIIEKLGGEDEEGGESAPERASKTLPTDPQLYPLVRKKSSSPSDGCYITPEVHLAYSFTWFSLSIASLFIGYYSFKKGKKFAMRYASSAKRNAPPKS